MLDRRQRTIDNYQLGLFLLAFGGDAFDLAFAEQGASAHIAHRHDERFGNDDPDCEREALGLLKPRFGILGLLAAPADVGADDEGPRATGYLAFELVVDNQGASPSSPSKSVVRSTGAAGWMVETACL